MRNLKLLIAFCMMSIITISYAATPTQTLQKLFKKTYTVQASFTQNIYTGNGQLLQSSHGTMAMQRPGRFRWDIIKPQKMLMIANGKTLWVYQQGLKQVTEQKLSKDGNNPAMLLSSSIQFIGNYFYIQYAKGWYYLTPRIKNKLIKGIKLKFTNSALTQMIIFDSLGQHSIVTFSHIKINRKLSKRLFQFAVPKGVDIIHAG